MQMVRKTFSIQDWTWIKGRFGDKGSCGFRNFGRRGWSVTLKGIGLKSGWRFGGVLYEDIIRSPTGVKNIRLDGTIEDCIEKCRQKKGCVSVNFVKVDDQRKRVCILNAYDKGKVLPASIVGSKFEPQYAVMKDCNQSNNSNKCYTSGTYLSGPRGAYSWKIASSVQDCINKCKNEYRCKSFNYLDPYWGGWCLLNDFENGSKMKYGSWSSGRKRDCY